MKLITLCVILFSISLSSQENVISALSEYLKLTQCKIFVTGLSDIQINLLSNTLTTPIHIITNFDQKDYKALNCKVLVHGQSDIAVKFKEMKEFQIRYVITSMTNISQWKEEGSNVTVPTLQFKPIHEGIVQVILACPHSPDLKIVNLWQSKSGLIKTIMKRGHPNLYERRELKQFCPNELRSRKVIVVATGRPPYIINSKKGLFGADTSVMDILGGKIGFRYNVSYVQSYGERNKSSGLWTGTIGQVMTGKADFGIGQTSLQWDRYQAVDYTTYNYPNDIVLVMPKPRPLISYVNFLRPYDYPTWIAIISTLLLATLTMVIIMRTLRIDDLSGKMWIACYYSQFQAGVRINSTRRSVWVLLGFFFIHVFFLNAGYLCNFRVYVMQTSYEPPINTDRDLIKYQRNLLFVKGTIFPTLYQDSPSELQRGIFRESDTKNLYYKYDQGNIPRSIEERMIRTGDAIITSKMNSIYTFGLSASRYGYLPFRASKNPIFPLLAGIILPKNVAWKNEVDEIILGLLQGGIIKHLEESFIPDKYLKEEPEDTTPRSFGIEHVLMLSYTLWRACTGTGLVFAGATLP